MTTIEDVLKIVKDTYQNNKELRFISVYCAFPYYKYIDDLSDYINLIPISNEEKIKMLEKKVSIILKLILKLTKEERLKTFTDISFIEPFLEGFVCNESCFSMFEPDEVKVIYETITNTNKVRCNLRTLKAIFLASVKDFDTLSDEEIKLLLKNTTNESYTFSALPVYHKIYGDKVYDLITSFYEIDNPDFSINDLGGTEDDVIEVLKRIPTENIPKVIKQIYDTTLSYKGWERLCQEDSRYYYYLDRAASRFSNSITKKVCKDEDSYDTLFRNCLSIARACINYKDTRLLPQSVVADLKQYAAMIKLYDFNYKAIVDVILNEREVNLEQSEIILQKYVYGYYDKDNKLHTFNTRLERDRVLKEIKNKEPDYKYIKCKLNIKEE